MREGRDTARLREGGTVQGEIVGTLITTVGVLGAAALARERGNRRSHKDYREPLMALSAYCGQVRAVARAAVTDCQEALELLRRASAPVERTAGERDRLFREKAENARPDEQVAESLRAELRSYEEGIHTFLRTLGKLGERIDALARTPSPRQIAQVRRRDLPGLEAALVALDATFERCRDSYFQRFADYLRGRGQRRLREQADRQYRRFAQGVGTITFGYAPAEERGDDAGAAGVPAPGVAGAPPCGYCIWRCPHAPGQGGTPAPGQDDGGPGDRNGTRSPLPTGLVAPRGEAEPPGGRASAQGRTGARV